MPRVRMFSRTVINTRPSSMTLNLECTEEPLSETQQILKMKLKEDCDRVNSCQSFFLMTQGSIIYGCLLLGCSYLRRIG